MKNSQNIFTRLKHSRSLPALPQVLLKLIEACNDDTATPQLLSKITFKDPSISTKVLQLVNSAQSGLREKITTLDKAIVYLGADTIKNIAISASVLQVFGKARGNGHFNLSRFWWHSLMCASVAKAIAIETGHPSPEEAFLSGLLHDIGKLVLWTNFREEYTQVLKETSEDSTRLLTGEKALGAPHNEVGAWLVRQWKLNSFLADAIFYHHSAQDQIAEALPLVKIVYAANIMSKHQEKISSNDSFAAAGIVNIDVDKLEALVWQSVKDTQEVALSFGIKVDPEDKDTASDLSLDKTTREALAKEIKNVSLVYGTLQSLLKAMSRKDILKITEQGFSILFSIHHTLFFLYDEVKNALIGQYVPDNATSQMIDQLAISLKGSKSIFAHALTGLIPIDVTFPSADRPLSIGEEQILRLLNTDIMKCIPLRAHGKPLGIIIVGLEKQQSNPFLGQKKLLSLFIDHVAMCLHSDRAKQTQVQLVREERINASTLLSRKVVHEVNNPLGIIKNYLKILGLKLPEKHPAQSELGIIGEEIDRVGKIIYQLNDFSQPRSAVTRAPVDVNVLLSSMLQLLKNSLLRPAGIEVKFSPDTNSPKIVSEKNSLKQVFINLIKNAVEAMTEGGRLTISTKYVPAVRDSALSAGNGLAGVFKIIFEDSGPGIPETIRKRLFEPFVSSKKQGRGLGLSIVHGIIKELNGTITCDSKKGAGTTFTINLPTH